MPLLLAKALALLASTGLTLADVADTAGIPLPDAEDLLNVARDERPRLTPEQILAD